jgi:hypothetical protein
MSDSEQTRTVNCPNCGDSGEIPLDEAIKGTGLYCYNCGRSSWYESPEAQKAAKEAPQRREFCRAWVLRHGGEYVDDCKAWNAARRAWEAKPEDL